MFLFIIYPDFNGYKTKKEKNNTGKFYSYILGNERGFCIWINCKYLSVKKTTQQQQQQQL